MNRRCLLVGASSALVPACASATPEPLEGNEAPLSADEAGRPVAPAMINARGPFPCVVDTAAQRTGLGQSLIDELALTPQAGGAMLHGSTGAQSIPLYRLASVSIVGLTHANTIAVPLLHRRQTSARAIIGMDAFAGRRLTLDFAAGRLRAPASGGGWGRGWYTAPVELMHGSFVIASLAIGAANASAVIDTGAAQTAGNPALLQSLGLSEADLPLGPPMTGVAGVEASTRIGRVSSFILAGEQFGPLGVAFGQLPVFGALGLDNRPALILGMDFMRTLRGLSVDFGAATLALRR